MLSSCGTVAVMLIAGLVVLQRSSAREIRSLSCQEVVNCTLPCVPHSVDGCPTCACDGPTCEDYFCYPGYVCQLEEVECFTTPCYLQPTCVAEQQTTAAPCPEVNCELPCVPDTGSDGCPTCACDGPTCEDQFCYPGYVCELREVFCITTPCYLQPTCVDEQQTTTKPCRVYRCRPDCKRGTGPDGCPTCDCPPNCEPRCATDYECQLVPVECLIPTCPPPRPKCVPKKYPCPPQEPCGIRCMYGLKTDKNGCQLCDCLEEPRYYL